MLCRCMGVFDVSSGLLCSEHLPFWDCWLAAQCLLVFHDAATRLPVIVCCNLLSVLSGRGSLQGTVTFAERLRIVTKGVTAQRVQVDFRRRCLVGPGVCDNLVSEHRIGSLKSGVRRSLDVGRRRKKQSPPKWQILQKSGTQIIPHGAVKWERHRLGNPSVQSWSRLQGRLCQNPRSTRTTGSVWWLSPPVQLHATCMHED